MEWRKLNIRFGFFLSLRFIYVVDFEMNRSKNEMGSRFDTPFISANFYIIRDLIEPF